MKQLKHTCAREGCGRKFFQRQSTQRYCSTRCRGIANTPEPVGVVERVCVECGKTFETTRRHARLCSGACRQAAYYWRQRGAS